VSGRTVYFEMVKLGDVARVAAVDDATGLEAVITGPANAARADLEALALRKLERLLADRPTPAAPPRRGKLV
jgi:hypothetical protein